MWPDTAIVAQDSRVVVVRRVTSQHKSWYYEKATNWRELEEFAIEAVEAQRGRIMNSGIYLCPSDLAEQEIWKTDSEEATATQTHSGWQGCC